jgi:hypothetical protein
MVTDQTKHVLAIIISFGGADGLDRWTQHTIELLLRYAAARECQVNIV